MKQYDCEFFEWLGHAPSLHNIPKMTASLNKRSSEGWELRDIKPVSVGFLVVYERDVQPVEGGDAAG